MSIENKEHIEELISLYSLGVLEGDELRELADLIEKGSPEILEIMNKNKEIVSLLPYSVDLVTPPAAIEDKLFSRISESREIEENIPAIPFWKKITPFWYGLGWAVAVVCIAILLTLNSSLKREINDQQVKINSFESEILALNENVEILKTQLNDNKQISDDRKSESKDKLASISDADSENLSQLKETLSTTQAEMEELKLQMGVQAEEITNLQNKLASNNDEINSLKTQISYKESEVEQLRNVIFTKDNDIKSLKVRIDKMQVMPRIPSHMTDFKMDEVGMDKTMAMMSKELMFYLEDPDVSVIDLQNTNANIDSLGRVLWNKNKNSAFFCGLNLPEIPAGKTYQLWAVVDGNPVSVIIFNVDNRGYNITKLKALPGSIQKFFVTVEPDPGTHVPSGNALLIGES